MLPSISWLLVFPLCLFGETPRLQGPTAPAQGNPAHTITAQSAGASKLAPPKAPAPKASPQKGNVGHDHHKHTHGDPLPRRIDSKRFHTSRTGAPLPVPDEEDAFSFVIFGDRTGGPASGVSVLADAVRDTNLLQPDLVMTVGDLINGYNQTDGWLKQMQEFKGIMNHLLCPWFPVAGNHDIYWRGENKPVGEHEGNYEMHFGPLWYAFEHKNSWFVVLYTDEGNQFTGEKRFNRFDCQVMSQEQFSWLDGILKQAAGADHVFVFAHHPRWITDRYGNTWERVHKRLVEAKNVTAVFGGHIHYMRSDPKDGIEYVTLATVGGNQDGTVPEAGYVHELHVVTVRKQQVALAALPVGEVMDVRELDAETVESTALLAAQEPKIKGLLPITNSSATASDIQVTFTNPTKRPVDASLFLHSADSRWRFAPDHVHGRLDPGATLTIRAHVSLPAGSMDSALRLPVVRVEADYLMPGFRYSVPASEHPLDVQAQITQPAMPATEMVFDARSSNAHASVASADIPLPDGPFTLEAWIKPDVGFAEGGVVTKTENSEYGIFMEKGLPNFWVHLGGKYHRIAPTKGALDKGRWYHIAGVFDGNAIRVYTNGQLSGQIAATGKRTPNDLPLIIGGDVDRNGRHSRPFRGEIDAVHLRTGARYAGKKFEPVRRPVPTQQTILLLNMDGMVGPWLFNEAPGHKHATSSKPDWIIPAERVRKF